MMKISEILVAWYEKNKRDLPWRYSVDPYRIWLSEVILQQTRISQGLDYYLSFAEAFPDIRSLAEAPEERVMKLWQGLGYYSRARYMHATAKHVVEQLGGEMPRTYEGLLKLKGVGSYTAAAIASICFNEPRAVVDGNVARVISRLFGVEEAVNGPRGHKIIASLAEELLDREQPGLHNQAIMEFGSLQCVPDSPVCAGCPLSGRCVAWKHNRVDLLPVKVPKRRPTARWMYFFIFRNGNEVILMKRDGNDIWKSLYQFPVLESDGPAEDGELLVRMEQELMPGVAELILERVSPPVRHQLTHRTIHAKFLHIRTGRWPDPMPDTWVRVPSGRLDDYPVPRIIHRYLQVANF
ncbi:MAG TPA: A/G-specific adenine glycosylase [Bacteroides sp.]|nr:A/G-specific adenine glycosylase [Bacteroides sp.]